MVARLERGDASPHFANDPRAFMAEDRGKEALAVEPIECVGVGMADACRHDLDKDLARLRAFQIKLDDLERFFRFESDGGAGFHRGALKRFARQRASIPARGQARNCHN